MRAFDNVDDALRHLGTDMPPENPTCILTRGAAQEYLERFLGRYDDQPNELMHEIFDERDADADNAIEFTNVQDGDLEGETPSHFVRRYELWQLWRQ